MGFLFPVSLRAFSSRNIGRPTRSPARCASPRGGKKTRHYRVTARLSRNSRRIGSDATSTPFTPTVAANVPSSSSRRSRSTMRFDWWIMLASKALSRSRTAMEMASSGVRKTPSGRTRYSDCSEGCSGSIQNRHQPAESQPRNWASTGSAGPGWSAVGSAQIVIGTGSRPRNAAASRIGNALCTTA